MPEKTTVTDKEGRSHELEAVEFIPTREPWSEYLIEKFGIRIRVRIVVTKIFASATAKHPDGQPVVAVGSQIVTVSEQLDAGERPPSVST